MPFKKGHKKVGGKKKGSVNKATQSLQDRARELGINPFEIQLFIAAGKWKELGYTKETKTEYTQFGVPVEVERFPIELRQKAAKDVSPYLYPQLKSVEHKGDAANNFMQTLAQVMASTIPKKDDPSGNNGA